MFADKAFQVAIRLPDVQTVLDIGSGDGEHAQGFVGAGKKVTTVSMREPADVIGDYASVSFGERFDLIWASHVLEHQRNPGEFLEKCRRDLKPNGWLVVTVPPMKGEVVGGHVAMFNAGILLYHLVLAGFDCRKASVCTYGYNITVVVRNAEADLPALDCDSGDIERLARWFPLPVSQGFNGHIESCNWPPESAKCSVTALPARIVPGAAPAKPAPEHVAILGLGPSLQQYLLVTRKIGGRSKLCDEVWAINALGDVVACDRIFHMDDVRIQELRAEAAPQSNIAAMLKWMRTHPGPIYTSRTHPDYPGLVDFPLEDVFNSTGYLYFNSTAAYTIAYAIHIGVKRITIFGMDFTYDNAHDAEKGRGCVEFWLGIAAAKGIKITICRTSSLMDACEPFAKRAYGYDTVDLHFSQDGDKQRISFTEREKLPTAEEVEADYDHSAHPNPLVEGRAA